MTTDHYDLVIRGGECVTPKGVVRADLGVRAGRIAAIGDVLEGAQLFDARGLTVLPGAIDTQVHFREPGNPHKEDLETGARAAVLGGVTAVFEMPNTNPPTTTAAALNDKLARARGRMWCDHAFYVGASPENADKLAELERLPGCCGVKVFMGSSTGSLLVPDDETLNAVLAHGTRRVSVHSEDEARLKERKPIAEKSGDVHDHPVWRDAQTALLATQRLLTAARTHKRRVHVLHTTTAEEIEFLSRNRDLATVEVTPQHLTLVAPDCYDRLGTFAQMNPPIRDEHHRAALWRGIASGVVDVIGSDHAPHTREEKAKRYPASPSGMPGVQTLVPLMLDHVAAGRLSLVRMVELTATTAARNWGLKNKGALTVGRDADFTIVDRKARRTITNAWIASRCGWTPFDGMTVTGWPKATVIRGTVVMCDDQVLGDPIGKPLEFVL